MTLEQAIDHYGSQAALAKALGLPRASISNFKRSGRFPREHQLDIQNWTNGQLQADPKECGVKGESNA